MRAARAIIPLFCIAVSSAAAQPTALEVRVGAGAGRKVRISAESVDGSSIIRVGRDALTIPGRTLPSLRGDSHDIGGARVAVVHASTADRSWALVVGGSAGRPHLLWSGELTLAGDPGERVGHVVETRDRDGDGHVDIVVGATSERVRLCGRAEPPPLRRKALDRETLRFRPVLLPRELDPPTATLTATADSAGLPARPMVSMLVPRAASSQAEHRDLRALTPPAALADGDPATGWSEGVGRGGRGEFVTLGWESPQFAVHALSLQATGPQAARTFARPRSLWLLTDQQRYRVEIPTDPAETPEARLWIHLPEPISTGCLSLVFDRSYPGSDADAPLALYELTAYSALDAGQGVTELIASLDAGHVQAARILGQLGAPGVEALQSAWPNLSEQGQLRSLDVLATRARGDERALDLLARAQASARRRVSDRATRILLDLGPPGARRLAQEIPGADGVSAATALARAGRIEAVAPILAALAGGAVPEAQAGLRRALTVALSRNPAAIPIVERWLAGPPPVGPAASVALALAEADGGRPLATRIVSRYHGQAEDFADRFRLIEASARLASEPAVDAWLADLAQKAPEWMTREAALRALDRRDSPQVPTLAAARLRDEQPRVRASAVRALARRGLEQARLLKHASQDQWFLVRVAALESLEDSAEVRKAIRTRTRDRLGVVRQAAIVRLTELGDRSAWPLVQARMTSQNEYRSVISQGIEFAHKLCIKDSSSTLRELVTRGLAPTSLEPDKQIAIEALAALAALGGDDAKQLLATIDRSGGATSGLRQAAAHAANAEAICRAEAGTAGR